MAGRRGFPARHPTAPRDRPRCVFLPPSALARPRTRKPLPERSVDWFVVGNTDGHGLREGPSLESLRPGPTSSPSSNCFSGVLRYYSKPFIIIGPCALFNQRTRNPSEFRQPSKLNMWRFLLVTPSTQTPNGSLQLSGLRIIARWGEHSGEHSVRPPRVAGPAAGATWSPEPSNALSDGGLTARAQPHEEGFVEGGGEWAQINPKGTGARLSILGGSERPHNKPYK